MHATASLSCFKQLGQLRPLKVQYSDCVLTLWHCCLLLAGEFPWAPGLHADDQHAAAVPQLLV